MVARNALIFKWGIYVATIIGMITVQGIFLQQIHIWGCIPFLYPVAVAVMSTYDDMALGTAYGTILGVLCDILLPGLIPCFYTLLFPATAMVCAPVGKYVFPAGFLCSGVVTVLSFLLSGAFHILVLLAMGESAVAQMVVITAKELALSFLLMIPLTVLFRAIANRTRRDD